VVGNLGSYARAFVASLDLAHDLAVLQITAQSQQFIDTEAELGLTITSAYPQVGQPVAYAGFPMGSQLLNSIHSPTGGDTDAKCSPNFYFCDATEGFGILERT
jgi:S1-C subfamily serine protease